MDLSDTIVLMAVAIHFYTIVTKEKTLLTAQRERAIIRETCAVMKLKEAHLYSLL